MRAVGDHDEQPSGRVTGRVDDRGSGRQAWGGAAGSEDDRRPPNASSSTSTSASTSSSRSAELRRPPASVLVLAGLATVLFVVPAVGLLQQVSWSTLGSDLTNTGARDALRLSLLTSVPAAAIVIVLGLPLAWTLARSRFPGRHLVRGLVLLPMVLPPVVGGLALLSAFGPNRPIGRFLHDSLGIQLAYGRWGVVLAQVFVALPFFVLTVEAAIAGLDPRFEAIAAGLGAGRLVTFRRVVLPAIGPSVAAGTVLAWARALGEFGATVTFAGSIAGRTRTLPLAIYAQVDTDRAGALALSVVLLGVSLIVIVALRGRWQAQR